MKTLLIGGARSGKSALASTWANERSLNVCALVTATETDPEMAARIAAHRRERPAHWRVREEPVHLGQALREETAPRSPLAMAPALAPRSDTSGAALVLVDCLTLWVSNCLWPVGTEGTDYPGWRRERDDLLAALQACTAEVIIVTNEVGTGIVPNNEAARVFRDEQGWLNQAVAAICDEVFFVTAGLPMCLKPEPRRTTTPPR